CLTMRSSSCGACARRAPHDPSVRRRARFKRRSPACASIAFRAVMRAIVFERNGGPEVLELKDRPAPEAGEGEVLVDVEAIGINYRDVYERLGGGYGSAPPAIIGVEGAGKIHETGERVAWVGVAGSYAEQVAAPRERLVPVPDGVDTEVATAALLQGMTAHYLAADSYPVDDGDWVIVHAAAGGVGLLLTQIAKSRAAG